MNTLATTAAGLPLIDMAKLSVFGGRAAPSVDAILAQHYGVEDIGGPSRAGWHTLADFAACRRRSYLTHVLGLRPRETPDYFEVGTLLHACLARHYKTGGVETWRPLDLVEPHHPDHVQLVQHMLEAYFAKFAREEAETWDVRDVEVEIAAEVRGVLRSARLDLIVGLHEPGAPCAPVGAPVPQGVWAVDHKTPANLSRDHLEGFGMAGQFMTQATVWREGHYDRRYGRLLGVIANVITKRKTTEPRMERIQVAFSDADIDRFIEETHGDALELQRRQRSLAGRAGSRSRWRAEAAWNMNFTACAAHPPLRGRCLLWAYCDSHGRMAGLYTTPEERAATRTAALEVPQHVA